MRLLIAGFTLILTTVAALAQMSPQQAQTNGAARLGQSAAHAFDGQNTNKQKVDEKAYNSALGNLPDKQYDPWHGVR